MRGHNTILGRGPHNSSDEHARFSYLQMVPVIARDTLGVGPGLTGILMADRRSGGLIGAVVVASAGNINYHGRIYFRWIDARPGGALVLRAVSVVSALSNHTCDPGHWRFGIRYDAVDHRPAVGQNGYEGQGTGGRQFSPSGRARWVH